MARLEAHTPAQTATVAANLGDKLRRSSPPYGATPALFDLTMAQPSRLSAGLAAFNARLAAPRSQPWLDRLHMAIAQWRRQYGHRPCELRPAERSVLPATLPEAIDEVQRLGAAAQDRHARAANRRTRTRLAATYADAAERLSAGFASALPEAERRRLRKFFARLHETNAAEAGCAAEIWMQLLQPAWLARLQGLMAAHPHAEAAVIERVDTPLGEIVIGGRDDGQLAVDDALFLADLGGDDFYGIETGADFDGTPQLIVDFDGDDRYQSARPAGYAAGIGRTAILLDVDGNDSYQSSVHGQGSAVLGVGLLVDLGGDDRYQAANFGQGAAMFGVGLLLDEGGSDSYRIRANGQGLGMAGGVGALIEYGGDDVYLAAGGPPTDYGTPGLTDAWAQGMARGVRGIAPGGIGVVLDYQGADRYESGSFGQGGAYYHGVGQLLDLGGEDDDLLGSRYSAGWGAHGGIGFHFNEAGSDRYRSLHVVGAGIAWDYSLALFVDGDGDDSYRLGGLGFGAASHHSASWFVDVAGADRYVDVGPLARADVGAPNLAVFADVGDAADSLNGKPAPTSCVWRDELSLVSWGDGDADAAALAKAPPVDESDISFAAAGASALPNSSRELFDEEPCVGPVAP